MSAALPVLYSFRRCPYAMRARLALAVSGQACELREVVLRNKPQGLLHASPKGTVPVLVLPTGQVLEQSLEIMLWALAQHDPEGWLIPSHGNLQDMLALIAECDGPFKQALDRCKYPSRYPDADIGAERARAVAWPVRAVFDDEAGFREVLAFSPVSNVLAMEASGPYHLPLAMFLHAHGRQVSVANPLQVKHFCRMKFHRAKTDRKDAQFIADYFRSA